MLGNNKQSSGIDHVYGKVLLGYSARFPDKALAKVKAMPEVDAVENDQSGEVNIVQEETTWGLACLSSDTQLTRNPKLWSYT
ncbi:proteinase B [Entomophthora muscae]|uniref:Proteinase B n=1 Tax=Entomophthora muscae TaxID=34485 RepID=A0ACC2SV66_9FUNG|nr:proteinase B [Entomophthora muscae]